MSKALTSTLIVRLLDQVSGPAKTAGRSILGIGDAANKASGSVTGRFQAAIDRNNAALDRTRGQLVDAVAGFYVLKRGLQSAIGPAISFESAMADVAKVSGFDDAGLEAFSQRLRKLAVTEIPMAVEDLAALAAAAAQAGVADEDLFDFTRMTAKAAVAWEMSGAAAGENLAKIRAQLGLTTRETGLYADMINHLSDNSASSAGDLVDYARRIAAQGDFFGYSREQTLALGSAMIGTGAQSEVAATSFRNMGRALTRGAAATKRQSGAFDQLGLDAEAVAKKMQEDAIGTTIGVIERIGKLPEEVRPALISDLFGDEARAIAPLLNDLEILKNSLWLVAEETDYASSVTKEFERRARTTEYAMQRFRNQTRDISLTIGGSFLPVMKDALGIMGPLALRISDLAGAHPGLTKAVVASTAGLIGLRVGLIGVRFAALLARGGLLSMMLPIVRFGSWAKTAAGGAVALQASLAAMSGAKFGGFAKVAAAMGGIARAVPGIGLLAGMGKGLAVAVGILTAPAWGAVALGIGAVGLAGALIHKHWDAVSSVIGGFGERLAYEFAPALEKVQPLLDKLAPVGRAIGDAFAFARDKVGGLFNWLGSLFQRESLSDADKRSWRLMGNAMANSLIEGVKSGFLNWVGVLTFIPGKIAETVRGIDFSTLISEFGQAGSDAIDAMLAGLKGAARRILDWVSTLGSQIAARISSSISGALGRAGAWLGLGGATAPAPANDNTIRPRAKGGPVHRGGTYLVGEEGPELRTDLGTGRIIPHRKTMDLLRDGGSVEGMAASARGGPPTVNVDMRGMVVNGVQNTREFMDKVFREMDHRMRDAVRDGHFSLDLR